MVAVEETKPLEQALASLLIDRLDKYGIEILRSSQGNICFFIPPGKVSDHRTDRADYDRGREDGAIHELQQIIRSSRPLEQAVLEEMARRAAL